MNIIENQLKKYDKILDCRRDEHNIMSLKRMINALPGITCDMESTPLNNHYKDFFIFFEVEEGNHSGLYFLTRTTDSRYFRHGYNWRIELAVGDHYENNKLPISYMLVRENWHECNINSEICNLIDNMNHHLNHIGFMNGFNLNIDDFELWDLANEREDKLDLLLYKM